MFSGGLIVRAYYALNSRYTPLTPDFENDVPFGSKHPGGVQFAFCAGHVTFLSDPIDINIYRTLSSRDGGEQIPADELRQMSCVSIEAELLVEYWSAPQGGVIVFDYSD